MIWCVPDINECLSNPTICGRGTCVNQQGGYTCLCPPGFVLVSSGTCIGCGQLELIKIFEDFRWVSGIWVNFGKSQGLWCCSLKNGIHFPIDLTPEHGRKIIILSTIVTPGHATTCVPDMRKSMCYRQYRLDDYCQHPMMSNQTKMSCCCSVGRAWGEPCEPCPEPNSEEYHQLCSPTPGTIINPITGEVDDVDECQGMVCQNGYCINTVGSFRCDCYRGYVYNPSLLTCDDANECDQSPPPCGRSAQCINNPGSYECRCPDGYKLAHSLRDCLDLDECTDRPGLCQNGVCTNFEGSFRCTCNPGFFLSPAGDQCLDIDECTRMPRTCSNGTCQNTQGSFQCVCHQGFQLGQDGDCVDVDECRTQYGICLNGRCRNTIGSFQCSCQEGYELGLDARSCLDINECLQPGMCSKGVCQNSEGSFQCTCPPGFQLTHDKRNCEGNTIW
ncbi:FBN1 [Cordylochernes scorpioides]|uniref:FBN1 n=1 Tax=Cordylochernes scorpioides TaxID=51811 RepID=A0ABY6K4J9_9ARAC|nr:FBN1 [Cordylochernes scorpioides]